MFGSVTLLMLVFTVLVPTMDIAYTANEFIVKLVSIKMIDLSAMFVVLDTVISVKTMDLNLRFPFAKLTVRHIVATVD